MSNEIKYFVIWGHRWQLSFLELLSVFETSKVKFTIYTCNSKFLVFGSSSDILSILARLGGIIKYGTILGDLPFDTLDCSQVLKIVGKKFPKSGKYNFSVSVYSNCYSFRQLINYKKSLLNAIDCDIESKGVKSRYVGRLYDLSAEGPVFAKQIKGKGNDFVILLSSRNIWIAYTDDVQDYEGFRKRDYGRPKFDKLSGMLPPKLARIMVNLGCTNEVKTVWDPFCGSGTVLVEAMLLDLNVVGTDISDKAVADSRSNVEWLLNNFNSKNLKENNNERKTVLIQRSEISSLVKVYEDLPFNLKRGISFVCEPYLGPPVLRKLRVSEFKKISANVQNVLSQFVDKVEFIERKYKDVVNSVVIVLPIYKTTNGWIGIDFSKQMKKLNRINLITPESFRELQKWSKEIDVSWYREDSLIRRKILVLKKR